MPAKQKAPKTDWTQYGARPETERGGDFEGEVKWGNAAEGDAVAGVLLAPKEVHTTFGEKVVLTLEHVTEFVADGEALELADDEKAVIWATPGLLDALYDAQVDVGSPVRIELTELVDTGKPSPFKQFAVTVN